MNPLPFPRRRTHDIRAGFTLIELLAVIGVIAVLAVLSMPAFKNAMSGAQLTKCSNNIRQWGMGFQSWMNDHDGLLPQTAEISGNADTHWQELIAPYVVGDQKLWNQRNLMRARFHCPGDKTPGIVYCSTQYLSPLRYSKAPLKLINIDKKLSDCLLLTENYTGEIWDTRPDTAKPAGGRVDYMRHHVGGKDVANILFADFHVEPLSYQQTLDRPVICNPNP